MCANVCCTVCLHVTLSQVQAGVELALVCKEENIPDTFEEQFPLWAQAIITYCRDTQIRYSALQAETADYSDDLDDGKHAIYS